MADLSPEEIEKKRKKEFAKLMTQIFGVGSIVFFTLSVVLYIASGRSIQVLAENAVGFVNVVLSVSILFGLANVFDSGSRAQLFEDAILIILLLLMNQFGLKLLDPAADYALTKWSWPLVGYAFLSGGWLVFAVISGGVDFSALGLYFGGLGFTAVLTGSIGLWSVITQMAPGQHLLNLTAFVNELTNGNIQMTVLTLVTYGCMLFSFFIYMGESIKKVDGARAVGNLIGLPMFWGGYLFARGLLQGSAILSLFVAFACVLVYAQICINTGITTETNRWGVVKRWGGKIKTATPWDVLSASLVLWGAFFVLTGGGI